MTLEQPGAGEARRFYASAILDEAAGDVVVKLVNATSNELTTAVALSGVRQVKPGTLSVLRADGLDAVNSFDAPDRVAPRESAFAPPAPTFEVTLPANSLSVVRVGTVR